MTTIKSIGKAAFIALTIANLTRCASGSSNSDNNISSETGAVSISYRSDFVDINDEHTSVAIDLKDVLERHDTFDAHELIAEITSVEKHFKSNSNVMPKLSRLRR